MIEKKITSLDFERLMSEKPNDFIAQKIAGYDLRYAEISEEERDSFLKKIISTLLDQSLPFSGKHRHEQWEKGWGENFDELLKSRDKDKMMAAIMPRYFGKYRVVRLDQKFVKPITENFEPKILGLILDWLFDQYLRDVEAVYEFGCGPAYNLFRAREYNPSADLWGLDWAESSQKIIDKLAEEGFDRKLFSHKFDYFNPDKDFKLKKNSVVFTVASLEQIGDRYGAFVDYLLENKPDVCINVEPIGELLDEDNLLDYLSVEYFKKRKYLSGYLDYLRQLEKQGRIKILRAQRSYTGSLFVEGHSIIVWAPI